jgi:hypothetical protein
VHAILEEPNDKETVFAAADPGAFESLDGAATWTLMPGVAM